jgi:hypothetical protein
MGITIKAEIKCSRCERTQTVSIRDFPSWGRFSDDTGGVISKANAEGREGWELLTDEGKSVPSCNNLQPTRLFCAACAEDYRAFAAESARKLDGFMNPGN